MKEKGFGLVELLVGASCFAILGITVAQYLPKIFVRKNENLLEKGKWERDLFVAAQLIQNVGRIATTCSDPGATELDCSIDFNNPPTGTLTNVRFRITTAGLTYEKQISGNWTTTITFPTINGFTICGTTELSGTPPSCPLEPTKLNIQAASFPGRFFRFSVQSFVAANPSGSGPGNSFVTDLNMNVQSSFYLRNPTPSGMVYVWGNWVGL